MTKAKHTPRPWVRHVDSDGFYRGEVLGPPETDFEQDIVADWVSEADSHLIAAAPDLLEALEAAVDCGLVPKSSVRDGGAAKYPRQVHVADMIRAAIAKAKGEA